MDKTAAYRSFLANVEQFRALNALSTTIYFGSDESAASFSALAQVLPFEIQQVKAQESREKKCLYG